MNYKEVMQELKKLGTEQNRKIYKRHGVGNELYGVSYANLGLLKKKIKVDHELAKQLWATGNHDAQVLATMVADPASMSASELEDWVKDLGNYGITDAFAKLASQTPFARQKMEKWSKSKEEWIGRTGWLLLAYLTAEGQELPDDYFGPYLDIIERNIHSSANRIKDAMNSALIGIGIRNAELRTTVLAAAQRIGKVIVDHGETNCKTPDAAGYIRKVVEHKGRPRAATYRS